MRWSKGADPVGVIGAGAIGEVNPTVEPAPGLPLPLLVAVERELHFTDCLLGKAKRFGKRAESVAVQKILDANYESSKLRRDVRTRK